jgi:hypothetical protein
VAPLKSLSGLILTAPAAAPLRLRLSGAVWGCKALRACTAKERQVAQRAGNPLAQVLFSFPPVLPVPPTNAQPPPMATQLQNLGGVSAIVVGAFCEHNRPGAEFSLSARCSFLFPGVISAANANSRRPPLGASSNRPGWGFLETRLSRRSVVF